MITGHEDYSANDLARMLMGDEIQMTDLEGVHGALLLLCKRVSELESELKAHKRSTQIYGSGPYT